MKEEALRCRVAAVNRGNAYAQELYDRMTTVFTPFVGQQILKKEGGLMAKVEKALGQLPHGGGLMVYRYNSQYSLVYVVKTDVCEDGHAYYAETSVYIGELENGKLTKMTPYSERRSDYTVDEITRLRKVYEEAKKAAEDAKGALHPFGEYDR